ncbi:hypothetical protein FEM48_Zijuj04G0118600 [Ziziphus jujuba var. spinosa]|uniref:Uncharacterized protein n=1 Tax=Ziziphus jujuba var. spinosa TaxID=714518 RepID=A0A978VJQ4_ZIZJJ|nr:hypothetical protein FEM48_Zijuj04G0118600 [Ziziphus jujuba var. spinosa]
MGMMVDSQEGACGGGSWFSFKSLIRRKQVGFLYYAIAEDYLTGFTLQCKGWTSVFHATSVPQFLGTATTNLNDLLTQGIRWSPGLMDAGLSKFFAFIYDPSKMSFLWKMCYAELSFFRLYCLPLWRFATVSQLCPLNGTSIYPEVSNLFFIIFPFIFMSSSIKLLYEIFITGGSFRSWINEKRIWMIKSITCHLYGCFDAFMKRIGMRKTSFLATNKVDDDEQVMLYTKGLIDFRTSAMFLAPLVTLMMLNMVSFVMKANPCGRFGEMVSSSFDIILYLSNEFPYHGRYFNKEGQGKNSSINDHFLCFCYIALDFLATRI